MKRSIFIYGLFENDELLYVGHSYRPANEWLYGIRNSIYDRPIKLHLRENRNTVFKIKTLSTYKLKTLAMKAKTKYINDLKPKFNENRPTFILID